MRQIWVVLRTGLLVVLIAAIGRPITGCSKNPLLPKTDSTDTLPRKVTYDSAAFYVSILINIYNTSGVFNDTFSDDASLHIYVVNGVVKFDSILNFPPIVFPSSGQDGIYRADWIEDQIGLINITGAVGFESSDTLVTAVLTQTGTVTPKWKLTALAGGTVSYGGGESTPGWPPGFYFDPRKQAQDAFKLEQPGSYWDIWVYKDY
ncbi:MAG TPA: hypothetical protein VN616_18600 [Puia sp.]|nr:hypothetical protein [Puia sp.]